MRGWVLPLLASLLVLAPAGAQAGGEVGILADVLLVQPESFEGGSLIGPPESRATWYGFGGIEPFDGSAMLVFSTGEVGMPPLPGTDLGAVGADNDIAGLNLSLRVPAGAHSMRIAYRILAPHTADGVPEEDLARILVQGDPIALDPWTLEDLSPASEGLGSATDEELEGTPFAVPVGHGTPWMEAIVSVAGDSQLSVRIEVRDAPGDPLGDFVFLVDGLRFDAGLPETTAPGWAPLLQSVSPATVPEDREATVLLSGLHLPPDLGVTLLDAEGAELVELPQSSVRWQSEQQVELDLPPLDYGLLGLRLEGSRSSLHWEDVLEVHTPRPRVTDLQPTVGPVGGGGLAVVTGSGFIEVGGVSLGGEPVGEVALLSPEAFEFVVPPGSPGPGDLEIFAAGGYVELVEAFTWSGSVPSEDGEEDSPGGGPASSECAIGGSPGSLGLLAALLSGLCLRRRRLRGGSPASP